MKMPNGQQAVVDPEKLTDYCLNPDHPRGKHKARVFQSACGFTAANAEILRLQLLEAAEHGEVVPAASVGFGARYVVESMMRGPGGDALVRSAWIVRPAENFPRFVTAYVLSKV